MKRHQTKCQRQRPREACGFAIMWLRRASSAISWNSIYILTTTYCDMHVVCTPDSGAARGSHGARWYAVDVQVQSASRRGASPCGPSKPQGTCLLARPGLHPAVYVVLTPCKMETWAGLRRVAPFHLSHTMRHRKNFRRGRAGGDGE